MRNALQFTMWAIAALVLAGCGVGEPVDVQVNEDSVTVWEPGGASFTVPMESIVLHGYENIPTPTPVPTNVPTPTPYPTPAPMPTPYPTPVPLPTETGVAVPTSPLNSLVEINVFENGCRQHGGWNQQGGGWVYEDGWVITALHTLQWGGGFFNNPGGLGGGPVIREVKIYNQSITGHPGYSCGLVVGTDSLLDLAVIKLKEDVKLSPIPIGESVPETDSPLAILKSADYSTRLERIEGRLAGIHQGDGTTYMTAWIGAAPGDSGSPIVDEQGHVIGMMQASQLAQESPDSPFASTLVGFMPIDEIISVWERLKAGEHLHMDSQPWFETASWH